MPAMTVTVERAAAAADVHARLARHLLVDGFDLVLDLERSHGSWLVDARDGTEYLDLFTFFASSALGMNHPALADDPAFRAELLTAALTKPSNSDVYTVAMARFVDTFARVLGDPALPHLFFVEGGALAVENALKVAFDWKSRWNEAHGLDPALGTRVLHLREAFHGRTGYTMSLTNTDPVKTARYPKFDWPRIDNPYVRAGHLGGGAARTGAGRPRAGAGGLRRPPARHRLRDRRADPGRGRRPPLPARVPAGAAAALPRARRAVRRRRGADRLRADRHRVGLPAARADPGRRRVRQEDAGLRGDGGRAGGRGARQRLRRQLADQLDLGRRAHRHGAGAAHPGGRGGRRADPARGGARAPAARDAAQPGRAPSRRDRPARARADVRGDAWSRGSCATGSSSGCARTSACSCWAAAPAACGSGRR